MKNYLKGMFLLVILIILASCTAQKGGTDSAKKESDKKLIHTLTGLWYADSYDYGKYEITYDDKTLNFNDITLEIEYTEENKIYTHEAKNQKSHYDFEVKEDVVTVYPSYEVEQSGDELAVGGSLAPIELKKERMISKESILGRWKSTESDYPVFIQIQATFDYNKVNLLIAQNENSEENETIPLTFENGKSELNYLNNDQTIRYTFSNYEETKMIVYFSTTKEDAKGTARPWILERL